MAAYQELARTYLQQLQARREWPANLEEEVQRLANLLRQVACAERQECLQIVEATVRLYGSYTAEHAAHLIRARDEGDS